MNAPALLFTPQPPSQPHAGGGAARGGGSEAAASFRDFLRPQQNGSAGSAEGAQDPPESAQTPAQSTRDHGPTDTAGDAADSEQAGRGGSPDSEERADPAAPGEQGSEAGDAVGAPRSTPTPDVAMRAGPAPRELVDGPRQGDAERPDPSTANARRDGDVALRGGPEKSTSEPAPGVLAQEVKQRLDSAQMEPRAPSLQSDPGESARVARPAAQMEPDADLDAQAAKPASTAEPGRAVAVATTQPNQRRSGATVEGPDAADRRVAELAKRIQALPESAEPTQSPGAVQAARSIGAAGDASTGGGAAMRAAVESGGASSAPAPAEGEAVESAFRASMSRGLDAALRQGGGSVTMRLTPPSLGAMRVELTLDQGVVEARLEATQQQAHDLLTRNVHVLRASLEARGLSVERIEITPPPPTNHDGLGQNDPGEDGRAWREEQPGPDAEAGGGRDGERSEDAGERPREALSDDGLDGDPETESAERVGSGLGLLNAVA